MRKIVILHGVGMHGLFMKPLGWRMKKLGYDPVCLSYSTSKLDKDRLFSLIDNELVGGHQPIVLIGHSFGGVMCAQYIQERRSTLQEVSHLVLLGCPIKGSKLAQKSVELGLGFMLGDSYVNGLEPNDFELDVEQPICSIAGTIGFGFRNSLLKGIEPSDGTVSVSETCLGDLAEHHLIPATHSSMVYQQRTSNTIHQFIKGKES